MGFSLVRLGGLRCRRQGCVRSHSWAAELCASGTFQLTVSLCFSSQEG